MQIILLKLFYNTVKNWHLTTSFNCQWMVLVWKGSLLDESNTKLDTLNKLNAED